MFGTAIHPTHVGKSREAQDISDDWERELQYNPCVLDSWKGDLQGFYMILWDISHLPKVAQAFQGFQFFVLEKVWFGTTKY